MLAAALVAGEAHADVDKARAVFAEGIRLFKRGDWEGARRLFREADAEHHAPAIVYNLGLAEEKLGHPQAAVEAFEAYIAETGDAGDLSTVAAAAIAQIKARSTRLRVETRPPGAKLFVDGAPLPEPSPATVLVPAGHHVVVAQGEGWRGEREIEVRGGGDLVTVGLESAPKAPVPEAVVPTTPAAPPEPERPPVLPAPSAEPVPDGLVWGTAFAVAPAYMLGVTTPGANNRENALSVVAGAVLEIGYALSDRFEFLGRGLVGVGPDGKPSYAYMGGPGLSYRATERTWFGASFIGGQFETRANDARYGTDQVFGVMLEASAIVIKKPGGEWIAGLQPAFLLTQIRRDNTTFFLPMTFGYRGF